MWCVEQNNKTKNVLKETREETRIFDDPNQIV